MVLGLQQTSTLLLHDEVWFFGFSRGAYVVRAVAGLLHYIRKLKAVGSQTFDKDYKEALAAYESLQGKGSLVGKGAINLYFKAKTDPPPTIRFLGLFDTVKALQDNNLYDISLNPSIQHLRHALALHEDRKRFTPELILPDDTTLKQVHDTGRSFVQAWFAGAHIDMGGSAHEGGLSLYPLQWMLIECKKLGLLLEFSGNEPNCPVIDDPLSVVFPADQKSGMGAGTWSCTTANSLQVEMHDLRSIHTVQGLASWYGVKVNRDTNLIWRRCPRVPFKNGTHTDDEPNQMLRGYCSSMPIGTIIHPSLYCLIDTDINLIMETKQGTLVQDLSEWSARMLGEVELSFDGVTKMIPNPGFWNADDDDSERSDLPPLRILICGYPGVGKSTLVNKVFGVDLKAVSERTRGEHDVRDEIKIPGREDFILHDSKGFEGGSSAQLDAVEEFVRERVEEHDLGKQLHVIWFCVEASSTRVVQAATERLFKAMSGCQRRVPVVVVATKKDAFLDAQVGRLVRAGELDHQGREVEAEEKLRETAGKIEAEVTGIDGGRVDAVVCVAQDDPQSIAELTEISSSVFKDGKTRLMYIRSQMARPDLKIHMAVYETMRLYKRVVSIAAGTAWLPFGPTGSRQGSKDDICKRIINCFGVKGVDSKKALHLMQSNIRDGVVEGLSMFWAEVFATGGAASLGVGLPIMPVTYAISAYLITPATAQLYLCTACDLILILAKSFLSASRQNRAQPVLHDVEAATKSFARYAKTIHGLICALVPKKNAFRSFSYGKIRAAFEQIVDEYWKKMVADSVQAVYFEESQFGGVHNVNRQRAFELSKVQ
ncbi:hypothetical protein LTR85_004744 [Meristemomyces frigidus]|nr:hypothetical protein LTR85_004744 [Meristemomyces frigidus]